MSKNSRKSRFLSGSAIAPPPLTGKQSLADVIDQSFLAYNAARLREGCRLYAERMLEADVTVGLSLTGALTPAGLGMSTLIPMVEHGFADWIVSTGANLYHDSHFALGCTLHRGSFKIDDVALWKDQVVRIYDVFLHYETLVDSDRFFLSIVELPEFQKTMGTAEFHYLCGKYLDAREKALGLKGSSLLAACYRTGVPVFTSSPGDSSIGMNIAAKALLGNKLVIDPSIDVNQTAAIVLNAKRSGGKSGVLLIGGGSPKNFVLQTEPQIQQILGIKEKGHDYFLQITDARPDTGGLSGATPSEAVSWGKVDPSRLPDAVVCYLDATVGLPLLVAYALAKRRKRPLKRLYRRLTELTEQLTREHLKALRKGQSVEKKKK
jgi:deoxyhypusine synthase